MKRSKSKRGKEPPKCNRCGAVGYFRTVTRQLLAAIELRQDKNEKPKADDANAKPETKSKDQDAPETEEKVYRFPMFFHEENKSHHCPEPFRTAS